MSKKAKKVDPLLGEDTPAKEIKKPKTTKKPDSSIAPKESKVENGNKVAEAPLSGDEAEKTKQILAKRPKINFIIPLAENEQQGASETVQINGYRLTIQKGVMVEIPKPVADILAEKYRINMIAGQNKRIDRSTETSQALS